MFANIQYHHVYSYFNPLGTRHGSLEIQTPNYYYSIYNSQLKETFN